MGSPRRWKLLPCPFALGLLFTALVLVCSTPAASQQQIFGVGDNEFYKGGWMKIRPDTARAPDSTVWQHAGQFWEVADSVGINILRIQGRDLGSFDLTNAIISQRTRTNQRLIMTAFGEAFTTASIGREIRFYPFTGLDSLEYKYWPSKFMSLVGGTTAASVISSQYDDYKQTALEQHYRQGALSPNTVIARDIVFDHFPERQHRWPATNGFQHNPDSVHNAAEFLINAWQFNNSATGQFVVVTGHLFDTISTTALNDSILRIDVIYEVPAGYKTMIPVTHDTLVELPVFPPTVPPTTYLGTVTIQHDSAYTRSSDTGRILATLFVKKGDLYPVGSGTLNWDAYREVALKFDARWCPDSIDGRPNTGPLYPGNESRRINLKVTWLGNEDVAIRSIALRDSIGQLMLDKSGAYAVGQAALLNAALHDVRRGVTLNESGTGSSQWPIIACSPIIESHPMHAAAFNRLTRFIQDSVQAFDSINNHVDSIPVWNETDFNDALLQRWKPDANPQLLVPDAVVPEVSIKTYLFLDKKLKLSTGRIPSIAAHNGGELNIPLLDVDTSSAGRDSIEYRYESTLQLLGFRQHVPERMEGVYDSRMALQLARSAVIARDTRRRMIIVPFCVAQIKLNYNDSAGRPERGSHWMAHIPEPAEMRTMMNLGLCYGAKGVLWQVIDGHYNFIHPESTATDSQGTYWYGSYDDFGVHSPLARGLNHDSFSPFHFVSSSGANAYQDTTPRVTLPQFFTGWNIRTEALKDIHRWIDQVGPYLMKLSWRDGYSMHFAFRQPYDTTIQHRPLANEIVSQIRAHRPGSTMLDSLHRTFVELGLFDKKNATTNPMKDTNHVFIVNRRCFERTNDISDTSTLGQKMDALAETRTIKVTLNMMHPVDTSSVYGQYTFVRVQEIGTDTTRLPMATTWRRSLDTVVHPDSAFAITLGPGRAALLRITYATPDSSIISGALEYNSQRKIIWDGKGRYYSTYHRWDSARNDFHVFFRRSLPVASSPGSILWDPNERCVSCTTEVNDTLRSGNKYPSLTMRTGPGSKDTVISIVWQRYDAAHSANREIVMRDIGWGLSNEIVNTIQQYRSRIRRVATYLGQGDEFGTPVIASLHGGDVIAWSDSVIGISARLRRNDTLPYWWSELDRPLTQLALSPIVEIFAGQQGEIADYGSGRFPTVPAFSHQARKDSSIGIAWQQRTLDLPHLSTAILYTRLTHTVNLGQDVLFFPIDGEVKITDFEENHYHPSIDILQDTTTIDAQKTVREGITWERKILTQFYPDPPSYQYWLYYQSVYSSLDSGVSLAAHPAIGSKAATWGVNTYNLYPNIGSINNTYSNPSQRDSSTFSIVYQINKGDQDLLDLKQAQVNYGGTGLRGTPLTYMYDGRTPTGSATPGVQPNRYAALYRRRNTNDTMLRTTRQGFAKMRPTGYTAEGREVRLSINDSLATGISARMHDAWIATDSTARGIRLVKRNPSRTDTLEQVRSLFQTQYFRASDSAEIGLTIAGSFQGDSTIGAGAWTSLVVELVDSASGTVTHQLDSFAITAMSPMYYRTVDTLFDLLLGTYSIRMRIDTGGFVPSTSTYNARYPVAELSEYIIDPPLSKLARRIGTGGAVARISAQPNPFDAGTEILFSIPTTEKVTMTLYNQNGMALMTLAENESMEAGRYSLGIDGSELQPGTYLVELRYGSNRIVEKVVVIR